MNSEVMQEVYYQETLNGVSSSLTCIYKNSKATHFSLAAAKNRVKEINSSSITEDENWSELYRSGIYICGDEQPKESMDRCQFSLQVSR